MPRTKINNDLVVKYRDENPDITNAEISRIFGITDLQEPRQISRSIIAKDVVVVMLVINIILLHGVCVEIAI